MQSRYVKDKEALKSLNEAKDRLKTITLIHQKLYQTNELTGIQLDDYVKSLVASIFESQQVDAQNVQIEVKVAPLILDIDRAVPVGLIINELITNSLKHAFNQITHPLITLQIISEGGKLNIHITDNGPGYQPEDIAKKETFGLKLIESLVKQIKGTIRFSVTNGFNTTIQLNMEEEHVN